MTKFHQNQPTENCPPSHAKAESRVVFRGIRKPPVSDADFSSNAELQKKNCDVQQCNEWGLSVWVSPEDALHAQKIMKWVAKWYIASGKIEPEDGVLAHTPHGTHQPNHYTFWKFHDRRVTQKFSIVMQPLA
jgi:hypothetical protein